MKKFSLPLPFLFTFLLTFLPIVQSADERSVIVKPKKDRDLSVEAKKAADTAFRGKYYALIVGNNDYKYIPKLETARKDAIEVEKLLKERYGFETKLLLDAKRKDILSTINEFRKNLSVDDSFLIYYAGHGEFDKTADKAYWLPVDAQRDDPTDWIMADDLTTNIKRIGARHVLIVADSCYSGTMTRSFNADLLSKGGRDEFLKKMREKTSRTLMASGGNEPVSDSGGGGHSIFADTFLKALREVDKTSFTAEELFHSFIKERVAGKSEQTPEYNTIKNSGHDSGDFVFHVKTASLGSVSIPEPTKPLSTEVSEEMKKLQEEKERLKREREELEQKKALMEEKKRLEEERKKLEKEKLEITSLPPPPPPVKTGIPTQSVGTSKDNMVMIPAGEFMAGVTGSLKGMVLSAFYIDKYEVTQREFQQVMGKNPSYFKGCDNCPVEDVTWYEADKYCRKIGKRLPTEWEWEKAAKGGTTTEYYWGEGDDMGGDYVWYNKNSGSKTHPVGQKKPNNYGLYDMIGNVREWTSSDYDGSGKYKTSRGGGVSNMYTLSARPIVIAFFQTLATSMADSVAPSKKLPFALLHFYGFF